MRPLLPPSLSRSRTPHCVRLRRLGALLVWGAIGICLSWPGPARAELWEELVRQATTPSQVQTFQGSGQTGILYRGNAPILLAPGGGGGTVASLSTRAGTGCSPLNFATEFQALFNANALENYFTGLIGTALSTAPLVLMCFASPTLCDAYKHFKGMASAVMQLKAADCRAVESAVLSSTEKIRRRQQMECVEEKTRAGVPVYLALDQCQQSTTLPLQNFQGLPVQNLNVVEAALERSGASPETRELAKVMLGEVSIRTQNGRVESQSSTPPPDAVERLWGTVNTQYTERLTRALEQVKAGQPLTSEEIQQISTPGIPVTPAFLQRLALLGPAEQRIAIQKLASALTLARLEHLFQTMKAQLASGQILGGPNQTAEELEKRARVLAVEIDKLRAIKQSQDNMIQVMGEIEAAAQARQGAVTRSVERPSPPPEPFGAPGQRPDALPGGLVVE